MVSKPIRYKASVEGDLRVLGKNQAGRLLAKLEQFLKMGAQEGKLTKKIDSNSLFICSLDPEWRALYAETVEGILVLRVARRKEV